MSERQRRLRGGLARGMTKIVKRHRPKLAPEGVVSKALDLLAHEVVDERVDRVYARTTTVAPERMKQATIGSLMDQRGLERNRGSRGQSWLPGQRRRVESLEGKPYEVRAGDDEGLNIFFFQAEDGIRDA